MGWAVDGPVGVGVAVYYLATGIVVYYLATLREPVERCPAPGDGGC